MVLRLQLVTSTFYQKHVAYYSDFGPPSLHRRTDLTLEAAGSRLRCAALWLPTSSQHACGIGLIYIVRYACKA